MKLASPVDHKIVWKSPKMLLAFGFGSGLSRIMPGTMGTLAAILPFLLIAQSPWWLYAIILIVTGVWGIQLCGYAADKLGVHDHPGIVWDEFVGFWLTMFLVPVSWTNLILGFVLFRFFDMAKPWPISIADKKVHGGFGIMLDDVLAGLGAWLCLQTYLRFWG